MITNTSTPQEHTHLNHLLLRCGNRSGSVEKLNNTSSKPYTVRGYVQKIAILKNYFGWEIEYLPTSKRSGSDVQNIGLSVVNIFRRSDLF